MININEWIYYYFIKDEEALTFLIRYLRPVIFNLINALNLQSMYEFDQSEVYSLADNTLIQCLENYRNDQSVQFITYYKKVMRNKLIDYFRKSVKYNMNSICLDSKISEDTTYSYLDICNPLEQKSLESHVFDKMLLEELANKIRVELKPIDYEIFGLLCKGYKPKDIMELLNIKYSKVAYHSKKIQKLLLSIDKEQI